MRDVSFFCPPGFGCQDRSEKSDIAFFMERPPSVSDVCATPSLEVARCPAVLLLRKMADRIQARAIRRCGELLKQVESGQGKTNQYTVLHDGADTKQTRTEAARDAGLSERQKVTALRVANVPPIASSNPTQLPTSFPPTFIAAISIKANKQWPPQWRIPIQRKAVAVKSLQKLKSLMSHPATSPKPGTSFAITRPLKASNIPIGA